MYCSSQLLRFELLKSGFLFYLLARDKVYVGVFWVNRIISKISFLFASLFQGLVPHQGERILPKNVFGTLFFKPAFRLQPAIPAILGKDWTNAKQIREFLHHNSFCRDVLSDVDTFLEFMDYLASQNADLAFRAKVKPEYLSGEKPVQVCVGFLLEHKPQKDNDVLEQLRKYHYHLMVEKLKDNAGKGIPSIAIIQRCCAT